MFFLPITPFPVHFVFYVEADIRQLEAMLKSGERNGEPVDTGV